MSLLDNRRDYYSQDNHLGLLADLGACSLASQVNLPDFLMGLLGVFNLAFFGAKMFARKINAFTDSHIYIHKYYIAHRVLLA